MRVITGIAKGRRLKAPKGMDTRPTADRAKEALFNIIGTRVIDANFLDLFAGTGAIGIEALSRGAGRTVFVERSPKAVKVISENLELTRLIDNTEILVLESDKAIDKLASRGEKFDIIFVDPPYRKGLERASLEKISQSTLLSTGGLVITESSKLDIPPEQVGRFLLKRQGKYGDTVLSFYQDI